MEKDRGRFERLKRRAESFMAYYGAEDVTGYMKESCGVEAGEVLAQADRLMEQVFTFEDRWDMEPCSVPYRLEDMRWGRSPGRDPEWIYMLNRHEYLHKLLLAYRFTGELGYVEKLKWYLVHWIQENPIQEQGTEATRTIDTGIRCMSWQALLMQLIGVGLMDRQEAEQVLESLEQQYIYMRGHYIGKYRLSNWGVLQTTAICQGYLWFGEYLPSDGTREWAWKELENQLALQVMPDGSHWEQSMMYHMEVLLACMKLLAACAQREGMEGRLPGAASAEGEGPGISPHVIAWLKGIVRDMGIYALYGAAPDHHQIAQCDSDVTDVRDVLVKAAVLTGDGRLRFGGFGSVDLDSAWLLGQKGIEIYREMKPVCPGQGCRSYHAEDTGNIYFRNSWREDGHFTYLTCGPLGSSHGHADMTHISLYYGGKPFLADSGRFSYVEDEPLRPLLKSAQAHNVCVIDDESHGWPKASWEYGYYGECLKNYYREQGPAHCAEMAYHARLSSGEGYLVIRRVLAVDEGLWMIVNDIQCDGEHRMKEYYHLDGGVRAVALDAPESAGGQGMRKEESPADGQGMRKEESPAGGRPASIEPASSCFRLANQGTELTIWGSGPFVEIPSVVSERYNSLENSSCLVKETGFRDRMTNWTCLAGEGVRMEKEQVYQTGSHIPADEDQVTAIRYEMPDGGMWILLSWNRETFRGAKLYECQGIPFYGKAAAIHVNNGQTALYRLRN